MTAINTNSIATLAANALKRNERTMQTSMERLSTGKRINSAKDDAAGLAIAAKMTAQVSGLKVASRNANDAISMLQTFEGASKEVGSMLNRMRDLVVQGISDTNTEADRVNLATEYNALNDEISRVVENTEWNTSDTMNGGGTVTIQLGANADQTVDIEIMDWSDSATNGEKATVALDFTTQTLITGDELVVTVGDVDFEFVPSAADGDEAETGEDLAAAIFAQFSQVEQSDWDLSIDGDGVITFTAKEAASLNPTIAVVLDNDDGADASFTYVYSGGEEMVNSGEDFSANLTVTDGEPASGVNPSEWDSGDGVDELTTLLEEIDSAIEAVTTEQANYGAWIARLEHASDNLLNVANNTDASRGRIEDADYAVETTELARTQIIAQAGTAMLAQANQAKQSVLALLK
jgi:flagellin